MREGNNLLLVGPGSPPNTSLHGLDEGEAYHLERFEADEGKPLLNPLVESRGSWFQTSSLKHGLRRGEVRDEQDQGVRVYTRKWRSCWGEPHHGVDPVGSVDPLPEGACEYAFCDIRRNDECQLLARMEQAEGVDQEKDMQPGAAIDAKSGLGRQDPQPGFIFRRQTMMAHIGRVGHNPHGFWKSGDREEIHRFHPRQLSFRQPILPGFSEWPCVRLTPEVSPPEIEIGPEAVKAIPESSGSHTSIVD